MHLLYFYGVTWDYRKKKKKRVPDLFTYFYRIRISEFHLIAFNLDLCYYITCKLPTFVPTFFVQIVSHKKKELNRRTIEEKYDRIKLNEQNIELSLKKRFASSAFTEQKQKENEI